MPRLAVEIRGVEKMQAEIRRVAREFPGKAMRGLTFRGEIIMTRSKRDFCPVKDGTMRSTGHVVPDEQKLSVTLGYGGPAGIGNVGETNDEAVGYAIIQHEELSYAHTVGEAEYLKKPMEEAASTLARDLASDIKLGER